MSRLLEWRWASAHAVSSREELDLNIPEVSLLDRVALLDTWVRTMSAGPLPAPGQEVHRRG